MSHSKLLTVGLFVMVLGVVFVAAANAQDPSKVDPSHYKVLFENSRVRVLSVHYGPREKSPLHSHPNSVVVYLTDAHMRYTRPNGKSGEWNAKKGDARWAPADKHTIENAGDQPYEAVLIEMRH